MPEVKQDELEVINKSAEEVIAEEKQEQVVVAKAEEKVEVAEVVVVAKAEEKAEVAEVVEVAKADDIASLKAEIASYKAKEALALKAAQEVEKQDFIAKAKDMGAITSDADAFGLAMYAIKSLCPSEFEVVEKALDKANENLKNFDYVAKEVGSSEEAQPELEGLELINFKAKALMEEDSTLKPAAARTLVRKALRKEGKL